MGDNLLYGIYCSDVKIFKLYLLKCGRYWTSCECPKSPAQPVTAV